MTQPQITIPSRAWAELVLLALIWGGSFLTTALVLRDLGPLWLVTFRITGAAALLWLYVLWRGISIPRHR